MRLNKIVFNTQLLLLLCSVVFYPTLNHAETGFEDHTDPAMYNSNNNLKALTTLQSLKNLGEYQQYQAPFVQDLQNTQNVRTLFVAAQDLPIVDIQLTFNAGSAQDETLGKGLFGMSNMAAKLLTEGTEQYSAKEIVSIFEGLGAQFNVNAYRDMFIVKLRVLSDPEKLNPAINMMLHVLNHSQFKASGLNLALNNTKVGQKQLKENPSRLMEIKFYRTLYGQHPYAEPTVGTNGSIQKITPELLRAFRDKLLVAQNMNMAITGNLSSAEATQISNLISQNLTQGQAAAPLPEPQDQTDFNIQYIPYNSTQAHVTMGHLAIKRNDPDRIALEVANQMFGGNGFNSILMKELRVKRGYTYGAYSTLTSTAARGLFSLSYATEQNQLMDSIQVAHQALNDFITKPISQKQLDETKEGMLRSFPMTFSSNANINAQIAAIGFYHLPADYLTQYQKQLSQLTTQQLQHAIRKNLHADRLTLVVVANQLDQKALKDMLNNDLNSEKIFKPDTPNLIIKTTIRPSK
ncbi:pitrilysin family protein [Acinetobacter sp. P8-3-8]|uniref:M16 family metallopeptidase n=1 Tax=Acinetobacter sp. P8-3-8 TaxID=1029823 RepID=UPI000248537F|nr:pitrilysin family protein [Acinetobacter sp. P8-3-8]